MFKTILCLTLISLSFCQIAIFRNGNRANGAGNMTLVNGQDLQYYGVFTMGTPAQPGIKLIFDTGSDQFWINDVNGDYNSSKSKTANKTSSTGNITYGSGAVAGYMGTEVIGLPSLNLSNISMSTLFANNMTGMGNQTDGLLGLGATTAINWVEQAFKQKLIPDSLFAFDLRNQDVATYFYISSASFPPNDQPQKLHWEKTDWGLYKRWMMSIESTTINNKTETTALWYKRADVDSGTSLVMFSQGGWDMLWNDPLINTNCQYNQDYGVHICPCTAPKTQTNSTYPAYPNVYFKTGGGQQLVIVPDDYMVQLNGVYCILGFQANTYIIELPMMIFGDCFMRNYFVAYNKTAKQIGFSGPESNGTAYHYEFPDLEKGFLQ